MESDGTSTSVRRSCRTKKPKYSNVRYHYAACSHDLDHVEHIAVNMINMDQSIALFGRSKPSPKMARSHGIKYYKKFDADGDGKIEKLYNFGSESDDEIAQKMKKSKAKNSMRAKSMNNKNVKKFDDNVRKHRDTGRQSKRTKHTITKAKHVDITNASVAVEKSYTGQRNKLKDNLHAEDSSFTIRSSIQQLDYFDLNTVQRCNSYQNKQASFHEKICPRPLSPFGMTGLSTEEVYEKTKCISNDKENALQKALRKMGSYESVEVDDFAIIFTSTADNASMDSGLIVLIDDHSRPFQEINAEYLELTLIWGEAKISKKLISQTVTENLRTNLTVRLEKGQQWKVSAIHSRGCIIEMSCPIN